MRTTRIVDLSVGLRDDLPIYPDDPEPRFAPHTTIADHGYHVSSVRMGSHTGTHVDAPWHFDETAPRLEELPLDLFVGPGMLADVRAVPGGEPITWAHLAPVADALRPGAILLLHTGWSRHLGAPEYFRHPYLDEDACRRILDRGVRTIGIDAINPDRTVVGLDGEEPGFPVHHLVARAGGVLCENLTRLDEVDFADPWISLLPLALPGGDGAPVRAVAIEFATHD